MHTSPGGHNLGLGQPWLPPSPSAPVPRFHLSQHQVHHPPCQQLSRFTCPTTSSTPILSIPLLVLLWATIFIGLCLALVTLPPFRNWRAGTTCVLFAAGLARNLRLGVGAGAAEFVCEFVFNRDTAARAQKNESQHSSGHNREEGAVSVAELLMFGRAPV